jgi:4'-phosphopantetheinyl transferase
VVRIWFATLAQADLHLRGWLDARENERFESFENPADRARFLLGAAMLRAAVGQELSVPPESVTVDRACGECGRWHGRPRVPGSSLQLSVSHSGLLVALAMASDGSVGIDVERIRDCPGGVESWTREEARFKAGHDAGLVVRGVPAPVPGHVVSVATEPQAHLQVRPAAELIAGTNETAEVSVNWREV